MLSRLVASLTCRHPPHTRYLRLRRAPMGSLIPGRRRRIINSSSMASSRHTTLQGQRRTPWHTLAHSLPLTLARRLPLTLARRLPLSLARRLLLTPVHRQLQVRRRRSTQMRWRLLVHRLRRLHRPRRLSRSGRTRRHMRHRNQQQQILRADRSFARSRASLASERAVACSALLREVAFQIVLGTAMVLLSDGLCRSARISLPTWQSVPACV